MTNEKAIYLTIMISIAIALLAWTLLLVGLIEKVLVKLHLESNPLNIAFGWVAMSIILVSVLAIVAAIDKMRMGKIEKTGKAHINVCI